MEQDKINLEKLSQQIGNYKDCKDKWKDLAEEKILEMQKLLPHGSGLDTGCKINLEESKPGRIIIDTEFHHMNENGYYDGWTSHSVILTPTFGWFSMRITGVNRNQIKDYLYDLFHDYFWTPNSNKI